MTPTPPLALARSDVDRAVTRRFDAAWLARAWGDPRTRVLVVHEAAVLVDDAGAPVFASPRDVPGGERYLLGVDGEVAYFAVVALEPPSMEGRLVTLREIGSGWRDRDAGLAVHAIALDQWHRRHPRCARCGAPTEVAAAGHVRRCPQCDAEHYPRTDPAVIMLVVDDGGRCLLGHQPRWPQSRFSAFAGFVEPGESLEQAVQREVHEEAGVHVTEVRYVASQPWPFPSSLMVAFTARAVTTEIAVDGEEITEARWFTRASLTAAIENADVILPPPVSIAHRLIETWYGAPLPTAPSAWRPPASG
ncbi:MAG: NAD(+) diphosphatase [Carbonactinosporaceae bacterium]